MTSPHGTPLELAQLEAYLRARGVPIVGELDATQIAGGRSNLTYRVVDDTQAWVLRRPPGAGVTPSAHDVGREFRIMAALQGSAVPVPETVLECQDAWVIGAPFTLVSYVPGDVLRIQADLEPLADDVLTAIHDELIRVLALLHSLPYESLSLGDFGRPDGFVTRQIRRWRQQWDHVAGRELEGVEQLYQALLRSPPTQTCSTIVHGDFRVDNTLLDVSIARVSALVDWEMATLGDPLTDLAMMCAYQHPSFDYVVGEPAASTSERWPSAEATAQRYAELTGTDLDGFDRYLALALFKLAVIAEGIAARYRSGVGSGPGFATADQAVAGLIATGLEIMAAQR
jgi:aminoglycoside phosphotransferase (APT) family kinase protein